jgi:hypothetical protein
MFHRYNDDLGILDDVINGVKENQATRQMRAPGSEFSELPWSVPNFFLKV